MVGATWHAFTDPLGWFLFWVQFLYFRVWYLWDFQFMYAVLPVPVAWVDDDELRSHYGWMGEWFTAEKSLGWLGPAITLTDLFFTLFLTEAIVIRLMDGAAKKNGIEMNCKFGTLQTFVHLILSIFTMVPAIVLLWVGLIEEFFGKARTFKETPKASMTHTGTTRKDLVVAKVIPGSNATSREDLVPPEAIVPETTAGDEEEEEHVFYREKSTSVSARSARSGRTESRTSSRSTPGSRSRRATTTTARLSRVIGGDSEKSAEEVVGLSDGSQMSDVLELSEASRAMRT